MTTGENRNEEWRLKAHRLIPGGAHTYSRGDDQYPANAPAILDRGEGCRVWDVEGNEYLDYGMALRAVTLGYGEPRVAEAAIRGIRAGNCLTRASRTEVEAAEALVDLFPSVEMVKFAKNGSTVTTAAAKLARAFTGRKRIARCAEHPFFSYDDWFIGDTPMKAGIPDEISSLTGSFHFNNLASLEDLFVRYPGEIACVMMEPATTEEPAPGFLQGVRDLCHREGAVFVLDEMITGFRWHLGGAQAYYGVEPDLCTFGKAMANGFSVAALGGRRDIMERGGIHHPQERVFLISTTHGAEMCGLEAFLETQRIYRSESVVEHLWSYGRSLQEGMNRISRELGIQDQFQVLGTPVSPAACCRDRSGEVSLAFRTLFSQEMIRHGVLMPWIALSTAHGERELQITLEATEKALVRYRQALEGRVEAFLEGPVVRPVFRRYN